MYNNNEMLSDIATLKLSIYELELKIEIYSDRDAVQVKQLTENKKDLELMLLDLMSKTNNVWLRPTIVA